MRAKKIIERDTQNLRMSWCLSIHYGKKAGRRKKNKSMQLFPVICIQINCESQVLGNSLSDFFAE